MGVIGTLLFGVPAAGEVIATGSWTGVLIVVAVVLIVLVGFVFLRRLR